MKQTFPELITFTILLFLNSIITIIYNLVNETLIMIPIRLGATLINGAGISLIMTLLIHYAAKIHIIRLGRILGIFSLSILTIESFLLQKFYTLFSPSIVMVSLDTNKREFSEFFESYIDASFCVLFLCIILLGWMLFKKRSILYNLKFPSWFRNKIIVTTICGFILISYFGLTYYVQNIRGVYGYTSLTGIERVYYSIKNAINDRKDYEHFLGVVRTDLPKVKTSNRQIPYVVIVLGESLSKQHQSLYGYYLNTTPLLKERLQKNELIKFDNVVTAKAVTNEAIRRVLTLYDDTKKEPWYTYFTLPSIMKAAGYTTYWLSNQDNYSSGESNSTVGIAHTSDFVQFTHNRHAIEEVYGKFDENIIPLLDNVLQQKKLRISLLSHTLWEVIEDIPTDTHQNLMCFI